MIRVGEPEVEGAARAIRSGNLFRYASKSDPENLTETDLFEREWADLVGTKHALAVTSGTAALICACAGLGLGPGDEVILPSYTFMATATAVLACGAIPVLADVDETLLLDPNDIERRISSRTKAIIPVHMFGMPCDMDPIMAVAKKHGLAVIEDACQMDAGSYKGRRVGSIGDVGCFSFNQFKIMTCGEGGALTTDRTDVYDRALVMHDSGLTFRPTSDKIGIPTFIGLNFRFNDVLSAVLRAQLSQVDGWLSRMRSIKARMIDEMEQRGVNIIPSNDPDGDCGITLGVRFESEEATLRCMETLKGRVGYMRPFDTGRHVYANWEPILEHRANHTEAMNPFLHPANSGCQMDYGKDMRPRTLDILKRTLLFTTTPFMEDEEISRVIEVASEAYSNASRQSSPAS